MPVDRQKPIAVWPTIYARAPGKSPVLSTTIYDLAEPQKRIRRRRTPTGIFFKPVTGHLLVIHE